ncbi:hypothetical protein BDB00DRAFT_868448 [Zychaea mexicana]|uniref:uncharacterized protein n=1 Tax=Zychaea mexicana TaxID=64656 RepID=UPI0022FDE3D8|nr:uncharacterized protein BDB00DRAFT_868448 [Zychaea mexicana]KAI9497407.1 hypothetical protein BDB00DRAFT_868448 [Zychaea mexicana]
MALRASLLGWTRHFAPSSLTSAARPFSTASTILQQSAEKKAAPSMAIPAADWDVKTELATSLEPYAGRSIANVANPNVAYRRVNSILAQNNVRREVRSNRYYEKPTVARRRKNIERNRKLFGAMVGKKVALIMQMKQRGM